MKRRTQALGQAGQILEPKAGAQGCAGPGSRRRPPEMATSDSFWSLVGQNEQMRTQREILLSRDCDIMQCTGLLRKEEEGELGRGPGKA